VLAGLPILFDLWGLAALHPHLARIVPILLIVFLGLHRYHRLQDVRPKSLSEIRLRFAALQTRRAFALGAAWWSLWNLENRSWPGWGFSFPYLLVGAIIFVFSLREAAHISARRTLLRPAEEYGVLILILLTAAGLIMLPLSMVALAPAYGILLTVAVLVEGFFYIREPRLPEPQP
jgi:hypothetical protein